MPFTTDRERKQVDASSRTNSSSQVQISEDELKQQDPFLFFSNDARRIRYLTGAPAQKFTANQHLPVVERKTRISFELHDSVILEEILSELDEMNGENDDFIEEFLFGFLTNGENDDWDGEADMTTNVCRSQ